MHNFTTERITAIARLVVTLACMVAGGLGLTIDPDALATPVFCALALAAFVWSWWKNNNVTEAATKAQEYLESIKRGDE